MGLRRKIRKALMKRNRQVPYLFLNPDEKYLHRVLAALKPGDIVIDLGAHVGKMSRRFAARGARVHAFEPNPDIFKVLVTNTSDCPDIVAEQKAVSDTAGTARLYFDPSGTERPTEGSTITATKTDVSYDTGVNVETVRLSDVIERTGGEVAMIKIDIEGMEYRVLNELIDSGAIDRVGKVYVEDHCGLVEGLELERDAVLAKIDRLGISSKFDFDWP